MDPLTALYVDELFVRQSAEYEQITLLEAGKIDLLPLGFVRAGTRRQEEGED